MNSFDQGAANYEANLLNAYLSECDGGDDAYWDEEESYWEALLDYVDAQG